MTRALRGNMPMTARSRLWFRMRMDMEGAAVRTEEVGAEELDRRVNAVPSALEAYRAGRAALRARANALRDGTASDAEAAPEAGSRADTPLDALVWGARGRWGEHKRLTSRQAHRYATTDSLSPSMYLALPIPLSPSLSVEVPQHHTKAHH